MTIEKISACNAQFYKKFLLNSIIDKQTLAFGAKKGSIPCGIILAKKNNNNQWNIKIFFVSEFFRKQGIGSILIKTLIKELKQKNCKKIIFSAVTSKKSIDDLEKFLYHYGFSKPEILTIVYRFNFETLFNNNPFIQSVYNAVLTLPKNIKLKSIDEIDTSLLEKLKNDKNLKFPENLSPFANEHDLKTAIKIFAINSQNEILGWMSGLSAPGNLILYRSFFVREDYRNSALGFFIINKAIKNHIDFYKNKDALCAIEVDNTRTLRFLSLYFKDLYEHKKYEFSTSLDLI